MHFKQISSTAALHYDYKSDELECLQLSLWGLQSFLFLLAKTSELISNRQFQDRLLLSDSGRRWHPTRKATQTKNVPNSAKSLSILGHSWLNLWAESTGSVFVFMKNPGCSSADPGWAQPVITVMETAAGTWPNSRRLWVTPAPPTHTLPWNLPPAPGTH